MVRTPRVPLSMSRTNPPVFFFVWKSRESWWRWLNTLNDISLIADWVTLAKINSLNSAKETDENLRKPKIKTKKIKIDNQEIKEILTVNGVRFSFEDGSWGLIRASSNKPSLVVVTESPTSDSRKLEIFRFIDKILQETGKIGEYDQKL